MIYYISTEKEKKVTDEGNIFATHKTHKGLIIEKKI